MKPTVNNTAFISVCDYENPHEEASCLLATADRFGVTIQWASWGEPWTGFTSKYIKVLNYLRRIEGYTKYVFFLDCRDVVFIEDVSILLKKFASVHTGGVLFNASKLDHLYPYREKDLEATVLRHYSKKEFLNSGCYCGDTVSIERLLVAALKLNDDLKRCRSSLPAEIRDVVETQTYAEFKHPCGGELADDDQFLMHLLQTTGRDLVKTDVNCNLFATCRDEYPDIFNPSVLNPDDVRFIGKASILHLPSLSWRRPEEPNLETYKNWIENNVLQ